MIIPKSSLPDYFISDFRNLFLPFDLLQLLEALISSQEVNPRITGGCVRDYLLGRECKDIDIELFYCGDSCTDVEKANLKVSNILFECANSLGFTVKKVGRSFDVFKLSKTNEYDEHVEYDFSFPRTEKKVGFKHTEFLSDSNCLMSCYDASLRRDFTINAFYVDLVEDCIYDFHSGLDHLKYKTLQHVSDAFVEDPLRALRLVRFCCQLGFTPSLSTIAIVRKMTDDFYSEHQEEIIDSISQERIWMEWEKIFQSRYAYYLFDILDHIGWLKFYPEIESLKGVPQNTDYHKEGDVYEHTRLVVMNASLHSSNPILVCASICHDFGKSVILEDGTCVTKLSSRDGKITSKGHDFFGVDPTISFLNRIGASSQYHKIVPKLVANHMFRLNINGDNTVRILRQIYSIEPTLLPLLIDLSIFDINGRVCSSKDTLDSLHKLSIIHSVCASEGLLNPYHLISILPTFNEARVFCWIKTEDIPVPDAKFIRESIESLVKDWVHEKFSTKDQALEYLLNTKLKSRFIPYSGRDVISWGIEESPLVGEILDKIWEMHLDGIDKETIKAVIKLSYSIPER